MTEYSEIALLISATKVIQILVGLAFAYFGYSLFRRGVYEKAGELRAAWGERNLALKQAAPGTFFALFGALVIGLSIWRGFEINIDRIRHPTSTQLIAPTVEQPIRGQEGAVRPETRQSSGAEKGPIALPSGPLLPFLDPQQAEAMRLIERLVAGQKLTEAEITKLQSWLRAERERARFLGYNISPERIRLRLGGGESG